MNEQINKYLTEAMGIKRFDLFNKLSKWEQFGVCWEWAQQQEWWGEFVMRHMGCWSKGEDHSPNIDSGIINPTRFATAIYNFLKERGK